MFTYYFSKETRTGYFHNIDFNQTFKFKGRSFTVCFQNGLDDLNPSNTFHIYPEFCCDQIKSIFYYFDEMHEDQKNEKYFIEYFETEDDSAQDLKSFMTNYDFSFDDCLKLWEFIQDKLDECNKIIDDKCYELEMKNAEKIYEHEQKNDGMIREIILDEMVDGIEKNEY